MQIILIGLIVSSLFLIIMMGFVLHKIHSFRKNFIVRSKSIENMVRKDVISILSSENLNPTRWVEDIINILVEKQILKIEDFPESVRERFVYKCELRKRLQEINYDISKKILEETLNKNKEKV